MSSVEEIFSNNSGEIQYSYLKIMHKVRFKQCFLYRIFFIYYVGKIFRKTNISYPLMRLRSCTYQGVGNVSFPENFANVINE